MTEQEIQQDREVIAKATPGPWFFADKDSDNSIEVLSAEVKGEDVPVLEIFSTLGSKEVDANWAFLAATRTSVSPALGT